jgi:hypothetical protein
MIDHGSRSTWGPGPSGSRFWAQKYYPPKTDLPYNFCFMKFLSSITVETVDFLQTLFRAPNPCLGSRLGVGGLGLTKLTTGKEYYTFCIIKFA